MKKSEFRTIQKKVNLVLNHIKKEDFKTGFDIISDNYSKDLKTAKSRLLEKFGLSEKEYKDLKKEFNFKESIPYTQNEIIDIVKKNINVN